MRFLWMILLFFSTISPIIGQVEDSTIIAFKKRIDMAQNDSLFFEESLRLNSYLLNQKHTKVESQFLQLKEKLEHTNSYKKYKHQIDIQQQLALVYRRKADYSKAISYYLGALTIAKSFQTNTDISSIYFNIGVLYYELKGYEKAKPYFTKSISLRETQPIKRALGDTYNRLGLILRNLKQLDSAIFYYEKAGNIYQHLHYEKGYYKLLNNMGSIYTKQKNYTKALELKLESLDYYSTINNYESTSILHYSIAINYGKLDNYKKALYHMNASIALAEKYQLNERRKRGYKRRSTIYYNLGLYDDAFSDQKKFISLSDSLNRINTSDKISFILKTHEDEMQKVADSLLSANEKALISKELERKKATVVRNYIIIIILFILLITLYLYNKNRLAFIRLKNDSLEKKVENQEEKIKVKEEVITDLMQDSIHQLENKKQLTSEIEHLAEKEYSKDDIKTILFSLKAETKDTDQLLLFRKALQKQGSDFKIQLQKKHPNLTPTEIEMAHYSLLQLTIKEIASLRGVTIDSVKKTRYRLRKKLALSRENNLFNYLSSIQHIR